jgi:DNA adenine methylase
MQENTEISIATNQMPQPAQAKPVFKWAGGKRWLIPMIAEGIWAHGGRYIEPFLGGGAVAFHLGLPRMLLNDANPALMECYRMIRQQPTLTAAYLEKLIDAGTDEETYYLTRDEFGETPIPFERAARLIYLNMLCFNGLYRENKKGKFNVPYDKTRADREVVPPTERIKALSTALMASELTCTDFEDAIWRAGDGDLIYADPPYDGVAFTAYTAAKFDSQDQERLAMELRRAHSKGATVLATNADTEHVREIYSWADIIPVNERRAINSKGTGRGKVGCVLITTDRSLVKV